MALCLALLLLAALHAAWGQNAPHLAYVLPAGGQQGTTVQVTVGGQFLPNVTQVFVSGSGVQASVGQFARPMNGMQAMQLRDRMQELQKLPMDDAVRKELVDIRVKLLTFNASRTISPVLAETLTLQVVIAQDATPGKRELRVATPQGLSNPVVFCVGHLPEVSEKESINVVYPPGPQIVPNQAAVNRPPANRPAANQPGVNMAVFNQVQIRQAPTDMAVTLPVTINGRIKPGLPKPPNQARGGQQFTPGEADRYHFQAHQGKQLVIVAGARDLVPYLADAVPGWFQAVLTLYDSSGNEVAYDDDYRFHPDPVIHYVVPKDGEYTLEIKDSIYRGREDFVYRITVGELPFVTGIFPLGGRAGARNTVELAGWNLPAAKTMVDSRSKVTGIYPVATRKGTEVSNSLPFMVDEIPDTLEREPNDTPSRAQRVKLPIILNGRVGKPGDWDVFRFDGRAGQQIVAEVYARRLESPLDSVLRLTDANGRQLAFNDDFEDKGAGLETHHADSRIMATLPANGAYYLYLGDAQQKGGAEYAYRLRISAPRPDFDLRVTPSVINAGIGMTAPITVYALRRDGFAGEISLSLKGAPRGFVLTGGVLPAGQDQVRLTLTVPNQPLGEPVTLNLEGRATIQGREITRTAVPAEDMMQAFAYRHLVPAADLSVFIRRGMAFRAPLRVLSEQPLKIPSGGAARFQVQVPIPPAAAIEKVQYELSEPPDGIELKGATPGQNGAEIVVQCDAAKAKPGLKGNLVISISAERKPPAGSPQANRQRIQLGALPAIPFEIVK